MKVLFTNPPVIRRGNKNPQKDKGIESFLTQFKLNHPGVIYKGLEAIGVGKDIRTGVRADTDGHGLLLGSFKLAPTTHS